jgi:hypothetical protein
MASKRGVLGFLQPKHGALAAQEWAFGFER